MKFPDFSFEDSLWKNNFTVIGIDEVGRGAFAGPVGVGGVIFDGKMSRRDKEYLFSLGINDSKKLTPKKRLELSKILKTICLYEISFIDVPLINEIGIGKAVFLGMQEVADKLSRKIKNPYLLIDAFEIPNVPKSNQRGIIRGDSRSISIAASSILAKVERDTLMEELSNHYPNYDWVKNKGYGTLNHRRAIEKYGLTTLHRVVFCKNSLVRL
jgi:ribonuclease HII